MSDTNEKDTKEPAKGGRTLSVSRTTVEQSKVRQNFSHGRSKTVVVETRRKRVLGTPGAAGKPAAKIPQPAPPSPDIPAAPAKKPVPAPEAAAKGGLTSGEQQAREKALAEAKVRAVEEEVDRTRQVELDALKAAEEAQAKSEREAEEARLAAETARKQTKDQQSAPAPIPDADPASIKEGATARTRGKPKKENKPAQPQRPTKGEQERRRGKLTIGNALTGDRERNRSVAAFKRRMERQKKQAAGLSSAPQEKQFREVIIPEVITIQELANRMAERAVDIIKSLMKQGQMHQINDIIDSDTAQLIAEEFGHTVKRVSESDVEEGIMGDEDDEADMLPRPPVVTVMGHVDHGKTSLLDALRKENVVAGEAGGITQHIGAYQVETDNGLITFLDTPGHAAFTAMRARGAQATDIVILVVAADDGVMPQTVEAIKHAKEAGVPIIVAINKIDVVGADPTRVRTDLLSHEIVVESMSGDVLEVEVSATKGTNLDKLLDTILLQSEILEIKANPDRPADGMVVEAQLDRGRGAVATMLVQRGTLKIGNIIVAGRAWGKVRALIDDKGNNVAQAVPSQPVEVLGLNSPPEAGDQLVVVESEAQAREITDYRIRKIREARGTSTSAMTLEQMMNQLKEADRREVSILLKADVQGSAEAIVQALDKLSTKEVTARVIHHAAGGINESDIELAKASDAVIFGFNVRANKQARELATQTGREIRYYNIIYDLVDDVKAAMSGLLDPTLRETFLGNAEVLEVFNVSKVGKVAGCRVTEGKVQRGAKVRLIRDNVVVHDGELSTLKRFKDEVKEVVGGQECGMAFENYQDMRAGDVIECFTVEAIDRTIDELLDQEK
ncbi:Translation initiation factor 2 [hydrothermal vent metagenome]|uniref:Translation initiation factor 2 n=1 Tax=hydrothermal vent metagenome TaxID=652676 RepID=A0A3B0RPD2_9ZZZZ